MSADHLRRDLAPVTAAAWAEIDEEARRTLSSFLAARRLVDVRGPLGWAHPAEPTGRVEAVAGPTDGVDAARRGVLPLVELRTPFRVARAELDAIDRGACDVDLAPVVEAARRAALAEDTIALRGHGAAGMVGVATASPHEPVPISDDYAEYPRHVARAVARLRDAGVDGPYGIALGPRCYTGVIEHTERGGYPVLEHLGLILGGPVVRAAAVDGAIVVSRRGGDVELVVGEDLSVGYESHDDASVLLFVEETLAVRVCTPEAAVRLAYPA